jgi:hypothetical protein
VKKNKRLLRSGANIVLKTPKIKTTVTYGYRGFCTAGPRMWTSLPLELRQEMSIESLKYC